MKKILSTVAAGTLLAATSLAVAQTATTSENYDWYMTGSGDQRMIHSRSSGESTQLLLGENGVRPADCPEGSFFEAADGSIVACEDETAMFDLTEPGPDMTMDDGQPFQEGAMLMTPAEQGASTNVGGSSPSASDTTTN